jgi:hypothetical protein
VKDAGLNTGPFIVENQQMTRKTYELQGYAIVLDKVVFVTRVFEAEEGEGFQFNVRFSGDLRLAPRFPTRHEADLQRSLLLKAINGLTQAE